MSSTFNVMDWLNHFDENAHLDEEVIKPILDFVLMWNLFEASACQRYANVQKIKDVARYLQEDNLIKREDLDVFLNYFASRYFENGQESDHFPYLNFKNKRNQQFVENVLSHPNDFQEEDILAAMLMIVYRYRNNLFHGVKWVHNLHSQVENFSTANKLLAWVLDSLYQVAINNTDETAHNPVQQIGIYINTKSERT